MTTTRRFPARLEPAPGLHCRALRLPFDPHEVWGRDEVPLRVTVREHTFHTSLRPWDGAHWVPLGELDERAAELREGEEATITVALDEAADAVVPPEDLAALLAADERLRHRWLSLPLPRRRALVREVASARRAQTRARRLAGVRAELDAGS